MTNKELADLIIPSYLSLEELENKYPKRSLSEKAMVTRFAPSPTGFLHTGSLFTAYINYKFARDTSGVFYLRIEDTDTKREVEGSSEILKSQLKGFGIEFNNDETYAPYTQSERAFIYDSVIHYMLEHDLAYPCFMSQEELEEIRKYQIENKLSIGCYKGYSKYRDISNEKRANLLKEGLPYVIRFKSSGKKFEIVDELRGKLNLEPNIFDVVIRKADMLPTYHFAHACDDHFMRTTHVIRGEEWLASLPLHYELFDALGFERPKYLHLPTIMKSDEGKRRKLSKRLDMEASVDNLLEAGYPKSAILKYLLTIANSNFEAWYLSNKNSSLDEFKLSFKKFSNDGALFDVDKLNNISKEEIALFDIDALLIEIKEYATKFNKELLEYINSDEDKFRRIMSIGKNGTNPRKDDTKYSDILTRIGFFYNEYYNKLETPITSYKEDVIEKVVDSFVNIDFRQAEEDWLLKIKETASALGFAKNKKEKESLNLEYMFSDYMAIIRLKICRSLSSPSIYDVLNILGENEVKSRLIK